MAKLSPQTRALIDEALARIPPEARRVPEGVCALRDEYVWRDGQLRARDPSRGDLRGRFYGFGVGPRSRRRAPWSVSEATRERIRADVASGQSKAAVARAYKVSDGVVAQAVGGAPARRADPVDRGLVLRAIDRGLTARQIADQFACKPVTIRRIAQAYGRKLRSALPELRGADLTDAVVALADGRRTLGQIARELGCSRHAVAERRKALSLDIPNGVSCGRAGGSR